MNNKEDTDINGKIKNFISQCDNQSYLNIMHDIFTQGIEKPLISINLMEILPKLNEKDLKNNFIKNINKIVSYLKSIIKYQTLDIYSALSCIYGAFLGDAMGAFCEFEKPNKKNSQYIFNYPNTVIGGVQGQVTDDSEMALSLAYAIMDNPKKEEIIPDYIYFYYGSWFKTNPLDFGNTTSIALKDFKFKDYFTNSNNFQTYEGNIIKNNYNSLSNGFLMRKSPFIVWLYFRFYNEISIAFDNINNYDDLLKLYDKIKILSYTDNRCTNPNIETSVVSSIYSLMALMAIKGLSSNLIIDKIENLCKEPSFISKGTEEKFISDIIKYYVNLFKSKEFDFSNTFGNLKSKEAVYTNMGYYMHSLKLTLYFLIYYDYIEGKRPEKRFREIMNQICNLGGDTDTNCCIVATVIGPIIGMSKFGNEFNKMIELIPPKRGIFSVAMILLFVIYLKKSNRDNKLVENNKYFLEQLLTMLYGDIELDY